MSWGGLPFWVYQVHAENHEAMILGATPEELNSGWTRSIPKHCIQLDLDRRDDPEYRVWSLSVRIN